jgi:hypothetical protein
MAEALKDSFKINIVKNLAGRISSEYFEFKITSTDKQKQSLMIDIRVHFIKVNGKANPKVFKLKAVELSAGQSMPLSQSINLKNLITRKHYLGIHQLDLLVNGQTFVLGTFNLSQELVRE